MHVLWEADVAVFKAHITTGPSDKVLDLFWIYDNKKELPENHRSAPEHHLTCRTAAATLFEQYMLKRVACCRVDLSCLTAQQTTVMLNEQQSNTNCAGCCPVCTQCTLSK